MAVPNRARLALIASLVALIVAGIAGGTLASSADRRDAGSDRSSSSTPGSDGGGTPGSSGSGAGIAPPVKGNGDCGEVVGTGEGPDTSIAYIPCQGDDTPGGGVPPGPIPQPVEPYPGMADVYPRPFDDASVADDDVTVTIAFVSGVEPCYVLDRVDVAYGTDAVTITLFEGHDPSGGDVACIEIGVFKSVTIALDEPLAGRALVDGAAA
jgi:hypothetical protein